jgi:hypothetical protein
MRSTASKDEYLLSLDAEEAEETLAECGTVDELSDELVAKIDENCLDECQDLKRQAQNNLLEFIYEDTILSLESEKQSDALIDQLTTFSEAITLLAEIPQLFLDASEPEALIDSSKLKISLAYSDGLLSDTQVAQLNEQIEKSFKFDPLLTTTYEEIIFDVQKGVSSLSLKLYFHNIVSRIMFLFQQLFRNYYQTGTLGHIASASDLSML